MVAVSHPLTFKDLATTPDDGQRYELLGGELHVTASPAKMHIFFRTSLLFCFPSMFAPTISAGSFLLRQMCA